MDVAVIEGIIMIISVVVMLVMGVPIGISIGSVVGAGHDYHTSLWSGHRDLRPEDVYRCELIFTAGHPLLYPGRQHYEQRRHCHTAG